MTLDSSPQILAVLPGSPGCLVVIVGDLIEVIDAVDRFGPDNRSHLII